MIDFILSQQEIEEAKLAAIKPVLFKILDESLTFDSLMIVLEFMSEKWPDLEISQPIQRINRIGN